jgi:hypothetical protein
MLTQVRNSKDLGFIDDAACPFFDQEGFSVPSQNNCASSSNLLKTHWSQEQLSLQLLASKQISCRVNVGYCVPLW